MEGMWAEASGRQAARELGADAGLLACQVR